jgi:hypothetical protein
VAEINMMELEKQIAYHQQMEETTTKVFGYLEIIIDADTCMPSFFRTISSRSFFLVILSTDFRLCIS